MGTIKHPLSVLALLAAVMSAPVALAGISPAHPGLFLQPEAEYVPQGGRVVSEVIVVGDVTGDGRDDIAVTTSEKPGTKPRRELWLVPGSDRRGTVRISAADGASRLASRARSIPRVGPVGDVNADGTGDLAVWRRRGAAGTDKADEILFGGPSIASRFAAGVGGVSITADGRFVAPEAAGDIDGDGNGDLLIVEQTKQRPRVHSDRAVIIYGGPALSDIDLTSLPEDASVLRAPDTIDRRPDTPNFISNLGRIGNRFAAGDVTGDGLSDIVASTTVPESEPEALTDRILTILPGGARSQRKRVGGPGVQSISLPVRAQKNLDIGDLSGDGIADIGFGTAGGRWVLFGSANLPSSIDGDGIEPPLGWGPWTGIDNFRINPTNFDGSGPAETPFGFFDLGGLAIDAADGQSLLAPRQKLVFPVPRDEPAFEAADINGDGVDDLVLKRPPRVNNPQRPSRALVVAFGGTRVPTCVPINFSDTAAMNDLLPGTSWDRAESATPVGAEGPRATVAQLRTNQQTAADAIRRLNAIGERLDAGIEGRDICGGAFGEEKFATGIDVPEATPSLRSAPKPRPLEVAPPGPAGEITLTRQQLLINQRIYQAAIARANALTQRMGALTGGDVIDGTLDARVMRAELGLPAGAAEPVAPSQTRVVAPKNREVEGLDLTPKQVGINYIIALEALRRARNLQGRIETGLIGGNFAPNSLTAADFAAVTP